MIGPWIKPELYARFKHFAEAEQRSMSNAAELLIERALQGESEAT
jgi:hypothetical protein